MRIPFALALLALTLTPGVLNAQGVLPPDAPETARIRIGPVALQPRLEIRELGVDSNVFNDAEGPKEDFVFAIRPGADARLRFGVVRLAYRGWTEGIYYRKYEDERALNNYGEFRAELRLARVVPYFSTAGLSTQERPNAEIDLRADRAERTFEYGAHVALLSRAGLHVSVQQHRNRYAPGQQIEGEDLANQLNEKDRTYQGALRLALTPITTVSLTAARESMTFELSPDRDSRSFRFGPQIDFDPTGLLSGSAFVGYRRFTPTDPDIPGYRGVVARTSVAVTLPETRFVGRLSRDVSYSYLEPAPYYVMTGAGLTVNRRLVGAIDLQIHGSRDRLDYRTRLSAGDAADAGADTLQVLGAGLGYRLPSSARVGLVFELSARDARREGHSFDRRRIFGTFTYGFEQ